MTTPQATAVNERAIFADALDIADPADRAAFLDEACAGNPDLQRRVEALIGDVGCLGSFLDRPALIRNGTVAAFAVGECPGNRLGPYKLLELIGEGGMGAVWMAEQTAPVKRRVALKIIKPGLDTAQVIARFEAERQALALMDHPNIARIFDAGTTQSSRHTPCAEATDSTRSVPATISGRPFFVMELVRGLPITAYCDEARLAVRERLALFVQVCQAVQHAHQKGIIHRDLKPGNVLVTVIDGRPVPKVIDFGVAKATEQKLTDRTLFTGFHQLIGTPLYMSPEQAELSGVDVDTRTDVYALGVLLYELLTGTTPFDPAALRTAAFDEVRRIIREEEPARPSRRLSTLAAERQTTVSEQRGVDGRRLGRLLQGELDWVVMRALEKDRNRRYESAGALAADVGRYLADEPVSAGPPTAWYRVRKYARRHRRLLATGGVIAVALVAATAVSTWQAVKAREAERHAADEAAIATAVKNFLQEDLLSLVSPPRQVDEGFRVNPNLTVRETLDRAAARIDERFRDQPLVEAEIRYTIGNAYRSVWNPEAAIGHLEKAVALRKAHLGPGHRDTVLAALSLAAAIADAGRFDEALALHTAWLEHFRTAFGTESPEAANCLHDQARFCYWAGKLDDAERLISTALEIQRRTGVPPRQGALHQLAWLSRIQLRQRKYVASEAAAREALSILEGDVLKLPWVRYVLMTLLGGALVGQEKYAAAEPLLLEAYEGLRESEVILGPLPWNWRLTDAIEQLVRLYEATNQPDKARAWRDKLGPSRRAGDGD